jgi:formylglycine-generating enzyme required for sulfatase activity
MKQNYKLYLVALLLVGAASMMTAGAQGSGKPTLAVFVVGMQTDELGNSLASQIAAELNRNSRYTVLSSAADPVKTKLAELRKQGASSIDRSALASWGHDNGISTICLVTDAIKGSDHMFYALLIDAKDSKVNGRGSYIRTGVTTADLPRVSLALSRQLDGPRRRGSVKVTPQQEWFEPEMVFVEGGAYQIGCNGTTDVQETDGKCYSGNNSETPPRTITVSSFSIGKYEVTRAQWLEVMKGHATLSNPGTWKDDDQRPIETISWNDICGSNGFLDRLNALTGRTTAATKYRLPTNAEWEYAARGCKAGVCESFKYSGSDVIDDVAWHSAQVRLVGQKKPNGLGIYDMSGNVWEWCSDYFDANYYMNTLKNGDVNPTGPTSGSYRVCRSGMWGNERAERFRVAARGGRAPTDTDWCLGFRVILPAQ